MGDKRYKVNCWEYLKCGREPGGTAVDTLGVCPVPIARELHSINEGRNGGRVCWSVQGTDCHGSTKSNCSAHFCILCPFFKKVKAEQEQEGEFQLIPLQ